MRYKVIVHLKGGDMYTHTNVVKAEPSKEERWLKVTQVKGQTFYPIHIVEKVEIQ